MRATACLFLIFIATTAVPSTAMAGIYTDDLSRCLVTQTSDSDKILLAKWIFTVMSVHPSAASIAKISEHDRTETAKSTARIFERLLSESCVDETATALKFEGSEALGASFKVLGEIAMTTLLADPKVSAETQNFMKYIDQTKINSAVAASSTGG